jgi:GNAT superfamily N-acetyltransferase
MSEEQLVNPDQSFYPQRRVTTEITQQRFDLTWQETVHLADKHTLTVQGWLSSRSPQAKQFDGVGTTVTSTGIKVSLLNLALGSNFPPQTPDEIISDEIERVKEFFSNSGTPFLWWLSPRAIPSDMGSRLLRHGFKAEEYHLPTMVALLPLSVVGPTLNPEVQVWQASSRLDLEFASTIRRIAFGFAEGVALTYFEDMSDDWLRGDPARLYLARVGAQGPPVAIGALIMGNGLPGVYVMATLPQWERQGLGKAILAQIFSDATAEGHELIILTAGPQAYPLYRQFGFEHIFEYTMYSLA